MLNLLRTLSLLVVGFASIAPAQSIYGTLVGTVTDESGGSLRAIVTATQTQTNVSRSATTGETGNYNMPNLLPGTYQLTIALAGEPALQRHSRDYREYRDTK